MPATSSLRSRAIVDAYGPEEQALGWYYYLENKIGFPFQAKCIVAKTRDRKSLGRFHQTLRCWTSPAKGRPSTGQNRVKR